MTNRMEQEQDTDLINALKVRNITGSVSRSTSGGININVSYFTAIPNNAGVNIGENFILTARVADITDDMVTAIVQFSDVIINSMREREVVEVA